MELTPSLTATLALTFLAAGLIKGVIGLGFPTVVMGILTALLGIKAAMALLLIPAIATNAFQAVDSGHGMKLARRFWPMFLGIVPGIWFGTGILAGTTGTGPAIFLGLLIVVYALIALLGPDLPKPGRHEAWLTPVMGLINGSITGVTGSSVLPGILYFQSLQLDKERFVGAMGLVFGISTGLLAIFLARYGLFTTELALISCICLIPSFLGMRLGAILRRRLSEERFKRALLIGLALLGVYVIWRSW